MNTSEQPPGASTLALRRYEIVGTPAETAFDDIARRAADVFGAAFASISFFDGAAMGPDVAADKPVSRREWFKSAAGLPAQTLSQAQSFFAPFATGALFSPEYPIDARSTLRITVIADALADKRVCDHPWVAALPHVCFYAGVLILSRERAPVGVLAVWDTAARENKPREMEALVNLADLITARLEARAEARRERRGVGGEPGATHAKTEEHVANLTREFVQMEQLLEDEIAVRQAAEIRLRHEKEFSDAAIASLPGAFFMFDKNGRMVRWNKSFQNDTAYDDDEIGSRRMVDFIAPHDRAVIADAIRRVIERNDEITLEADLLSKHGRESPYIFHGRALDIGAERYCIGVGRDITERRRTEREITDAKERLDLALAGSSLALWD